MSLTFCPIDLFQSPFVIPLRRDSFLHSGRTSSAGAKIVINPESMSITIISQRSPGERVEFVEVFFLEMLENHLHAVSKSVILAVVVREHSKMIIDVFSDCLGIDRFQIDAIGKGVADWFDRVVRVPSAWCGARGTCHCR